MGDGCHSMNDVRWFFRGTGDSHGTSSHASKPERARTGLFAQAESMRRRLHDSMSEPAYDVTDLYHENGIAQSIAGSQRFEHLTLTIISINAIWIAIDSDWNTAKNPVEADIVFTIADNIFCLYSVQERHHHKWA